MSDEKPTVNVHLVRRTMAAIRSNPAAWNQDSFIGEKSCGTTYCFAGWALTLVHGPQWRGTLRFFPTVEAQGLLGLSRDQLHAITYTGNLGLNHDVDAFERHVTAVTGVTFEVSA